MVGTQPRRGSYPFGKEGQEARIQAVGFRQLARRFAEVADLAGIDDHDRQLRRRQRVRQGGFIAPCTLEDDQRRHEALQPRDGGRDPTRVIRRRPQTVIRAAGHDEVRFGDIDTDEQCRAECHPCLRV